MLYTKLRYLRKENKISSIEMAHSIGLRSNSAYLKKETGKVELSLKEAKRIADMFDMNIEELFFDDIVYEWETLHQMVYNYRVILCMDNLGVGKNLWYTKRKHIERMDSNVEIERKYTIKYLPENLENYEKKVIEQGYLCTDPVVRIRKSNEDFILTYKSKVDVENKEILTARVNHEIEMPLTEEGYEHLKEKVDHNMVYKTRYIIPLKNGLSAELDIFERNLKGLIFVEVEFGTIEDVEIFNAPEWFSKDVSFNYKYTNSYLSKLDCWEV